MDVLTMLFLLFVGCLLFGLAHYFKMRMEVNRLRAQLAETEAHSEPLPLAPVSLAGAGQALKNPPTDLQATLERLQGDYAMPLGWSVLNGRAELVAVHLKNDVNHILLTGQSGSGKDNAALNMLLSLALNHRADQVQFAILDGKILDWTHWRNKKHIWYLPSQPEDMANAMQKLTDERKRRISILVEAGVKKWENFTGAMPLLVVFVSELNLLQNAVGKSNLTSWLNAELTSARAVGIRYIIATQNASNFDTQWRSQISLFMAGYQNNDNADMPNTGMYTKELEERGVIAPSNLPSESGLFVAVQGRNGLNIRTSYISEDHEKYLLAQLPNKPKTPSKSQPSITVGNPPISDPILADLLSLDTPDLGDYELEPLEDETDRYKGVIGHSNGLEAAKVSHEAQRSVSGFSPSGQGGEALPVSTLLIPEHEQRRIIAVAKKAPSRRQACKELYGSVGGNGYKHLAMVCDALGLLQGGAAVGK